MIKKITRTANTLFNRNNASNIAKMMKSTSSVTKNLSKVEKMAHGSIRNRVIPTGYKNSMINRLNGGFGSVVGGFTEGTKRLARVTLSSKTSMTAQFAVGSAAMAGISIMQGGLHKMNQVMTERYMRDSRYSTQLLTQTNIGQARGNSSLNLGNHTGLSLSMHKGRHG